MPDFRKLRVFVLAEELSEAVHRLLPAIPAHRAPGLRAQLSRAVSSIPANIAEGAGRDSVRQYMRGLSIARGSSHETAVHLRLASSISNGQAVELRRCVQRAHVVSAMLSNLIAKIEKDGAIAENQRREKRQWERRRERQQRYER